MPRRHGTADERLLRPEPQGLLLNDADLEARRRRWASVVGLSVDQLVAWGALYYAYAVLSAPIAAGLGISTQLVAGAFSFALLVSGVTALPVGRALDRHGARVVLLVGSIAGAIALVALSAAQGIATLFLAFGLLGAAHAMALYEPAIRAVVDWFPRDRERSGALLLLTCVGGFASTAFLPLTAWLLRALGWRSATAVLASLVAVVGMAAVAMLAPTRGHERGHGPKRDALHRDRRSALVAVAFALQAFASTGVSVALVWFLIAEGRELAGAALLAGLAGAAQVPGRLGLVLLQRAIPSQRRVPCLFLVQALAILGLAADSQVVSTVAVLVFGLAGGTMTLERATILTEWFGPAGFGVRSGRLAFVGSLARASSPYAVELARTAVGFPMVFRGLAFVLVGGGALLAIAGRDARSAALPLGP